MANRYAPSVRNKVSLKFTFGFNDFPPEIRQMNFFGAFLLACQLI
jgi:hypothetical protein